MKEMREKFEADTDDGVVGVTIMAEKYGVVGYHNHSVGDEHGWTFSSSNVVDYRTWASANNFSLGDFLLFSYPQGDHDIVVTYNETVFRTCDYLDGNDGDYEVWGQAGTSTFSAIPLVRTGLNYFFCGAEGGEHCKGGMKFAINVTEGEGLPASLMVPPAAPVDEDGGGGNGVDGERGGGNGGDGGGGDGGNGGNGGAGGDTKSNGGDGGDASYASGAAPGSFGLFLVILMVIATLLFHGHESCSLSYSS